MKKNVYILIMLILGMHIIQAKPVTPAKAKDLALNFYKQSSTKIPETLTLAYTETSPTGEALYYVFNVNTNDGFVIITADDAMHPIIGYSTEKQFTMPDEGNRTIGYWMTGRKKEIMSIKAQKLEATNDIVQEWAGNFSAAKNINNASQRNNGANAVVTTSVVVAPLVQSTWNQNGGGSVPYNKYCPSSSVTGCVATAMAQIMRFWGYPTHGVGSSSYCDCTADGFTEQYGTLTANYGTATYSWSATSMPLTSSTSGIATLMQNLGVSVDMDYSPSGSGAQVLSVDAGGGPCAQQSYTLYFAYDQYTIKGYQRGDSTSSSSSYNYTYAQWLNLIETDLNAGRPVQYAGQDPTQGGHTWVCDGYESNNYVHMNWGWGGSDDGYFSIDNLLTTNGGFDPSLDHEILVGIQPPSSLDAGIAAITGPVGVLCVSTFTPSVTLENFGQTTLTSCTINYQLNSGTIQTYSWTGSLATDHTVTINLPATTLSSTGSYTLAAYTSNPNNGTDAYAANNQSTGSFLYATVGSVLPLVEGFEGSTSLPSGWTTYDPNATDFTKWQVVNGVSHTGSNSIGFNNCDGDGSIDMTGFKEYLYTSTYDFSSATSGTVKFDVGYVPAYDSGQSPPLLTDTLAVLYSINCGTTWTRIYYKGGLQLATAPQFTIETTVNCISPTSSQWRTDSVVVPALSGQSNVEFAFENISDYGNWLYIDNINIKATASTTGISTFTNNHGVMVYPNPAHDNLFINTTENTTSYSITDIIGQTVIADQKVTAQQTQSIDISSLASGVYLVKINSSDNQAKVIRFIKN